MAGGDDHLSGLAGNDVFYGGGGNDLVTPAAAMTMRMAASNT